MRMRDALKDALFQDQAMSVVCLEYGVDEVESELVEFRSDLTFQLKELSGVDPWRRQVTALIIRCKSRLREIEKGEW